MNEINLLEKTAGDLKSIQGLNNTQDTHTHAECYHIFSFKWRRKPSEMRGRLELSDQRLQCLSCWFSVHLQFNQ